jgi:hypothetical protein
MQQGKVISAYIKPDYLARLDALRGSTSRSHAMGMVLEYILSQNDEWVTSLICKSPE